MHNKAYVRKSLNLRVYAEIGVRKFLIVTLLVFQRSGEVFRVPGSGLHLFASRRQRDALMQQSAASQVG